MLNKLFVRNYALIRHLELSFDRGLTIITGETGAGKSIILGALGLVLGNRADTATLLDKNEKCIVEGHFDLTGISCSDFFKGNDLDFDNHTVMRREISPAGRSRAFINDTPVTLDLMKELGSILIDIHSQHETLMVGNNRFQLGVLDSFAGHNGLLADYGAEYARYREIEKEYRMLSEQGSKNSEDLEYYTFQLKQLEEARLVHGEEQELRSEHEILSHAAEIHEALSESASMITGENHSLMRALYDIRRRMEGIAPFYPAAAEFLKRVEPVTIEINDLGNEMENLAGSVEADPSRLEVVTERIDLLFSLMQKHRVETSEALIDLRDSISKRTEELSRTDERVEYLEGEFDKSVSQLTQYASAISANRMKASGEVENEMISLLQQLGMPNARFGVKLTMLESFGPSGKDHADFLFTANRQVAPESLGRIASGGELSRVMLSLKSLLSDNRSLPTIFFDEIDAGVSGETAAMVGEILSGMGKKMQVINITHLPQVAALGSRHYFVYKEDDGESTITHLKLLTEGERLKEVARLLSGAEITEASLQNARELIRNR